jgi:hypothetical protein
MKRGIILALVTVVLIAGCIGNRQSAPDTMGGRFLPGYEAWVHTFPNYGRTVEIVEHKNVSAASFQGLLSFLKNDSVNNTKVCSATDNNCVDFAARLHNNAEACGINCSIVTFWYKDRGGRDCDHAINAFLTTDRGVVYVDGNSMEERFVFLDPSTREYGYGRLDSVASVADYDSCGRTGNYYVEGKVIGGLLCMREPSAASARRIMSEQSNMTVSGW